MAETHKPFRELIKPHSNFEFIEKRHKWALISVLAIVVCIASLFVNKSVRGDFLNWTIDFKGGTEMIFAFEDSEGNPSPIDAAVIRTTLKDAGKSGFTVSNFAWTTEVDGKEVQAAGLMVRTPEFGAVSSADQKKIAKAFHESFKDVGVLKTSWSGDRLFVRASGPVEFSRAKEFFSGQNQTLREWSKRDITEFSVPAKGTEEYNIQFSLRGLDAQYQELLSTSLGAGVVIKIQNVYGVGARAGKKLRNDGIKSLFYVMALIMVYLAFRFDIRYAPGAVIALLHDAILVVGVFAITWQEVSLTTVAALLTVIGYSVNDSVVIFDRIRENVIRIKDKKFARIINISLNETMARTLLTSITLFVVTLMMNILGTGLVRNFAFAMNIGVIVGVYSSIFVASPVALAIHNKWYSSPPKSSDS
ncbi:MAG: protein translocase subunit SecF [Kofleriaceae bacterium]|nr:protein translocase subunit SecF [Kofleriaceae bacterium]